MSRDLSPTGILFHSRSRFSIGERVVLMFGLSTIVTAIGRVVRSTKDATPSMFPYATAVQFDRPVS